MQGDEEGGTTYGFPALSGSSMRAIERFRRAVDSDEETGVVVREVNETRKNRGSAVHQAIWEPDL